jgi:hypothetical protein
VQTKEIIKDFLGEFLEEDKFTDEFIESLDTNNIFMIHHLANKSIQMYTRMNPKLIYFASNSLFAKEYETKFPILYPLMNLMQLGISNYYDVSGSLNVSMN